MFSISGKTPLERILFCEPQQMFYEKRDNDEVIMGVFV